MLKLVFGRIKGFLLLLALLCAAGVVMFDALPVLMYPQTRRPMVTVTSVLGVVVMLASSCGRA